MLVLFRITQAQNLVAYFPFNNNALDYSGFNNNGMLFGTIISAVDRFGNPCGALKFNGVDSYIEVPNSVTLQSISKAFSVTCWFKIDSLPFQNDYKWLTLICKGKHSLESDNNPQYRVQTFQSNLQSTISINTDFTEYDYNHKNHPLERGKWNFYAVTYDGNVIKAFLNNARIWEFPYSKNLTNNTESMYIGRDDPGSTELFCGSLDDLRIYSSGLSDSEVLSIYNNIGLIYPEDEFTIDCPGNEQFVAEKNLCSAIVNYKGPVIDINCNSVKLKQIAGLVSGSKFTVGNHLIEFEAVSSTGFKRMCMKRIKVVDVENPRMLCMNDTIITIYDRSKEGVIFNYSIPKATDNCSVDTILMIQGIKSGALFPLGTTSVIFKAVDCYGNYTTCSFNVNVIDSSLASENVNNVKGKMGYMTDSVKYTKSIEFNSCIVTLIMYDDSQQDFDSISVYFNGIEIVKCEMIKLKQNGTINRAILLNPSEPNDFVVKAWNTGSISPNTLKIDFFEGYFIDKIKKIKNRKPDKVSILHSKPGIAAGLNLYCKAK